ncbi:hypothetical protein Tco_0852002 [Tanacetum coccineum]
MRGRREWRGSGGGGRVKRVSWRVGCGGERGWSGVAGRGEGSWSVGEMEQGSEYGLGVPRVAEDRGMRGWWRGMEAVRNGWGEWVMRWKRRVKVGGGEWRGGGMWWKEGSRRKERLRRGGGRVVCGLVGGGAEWRMAGREGGGRSEGREGRGVVGGTGARWLSLEGWGVVRLGRSWGGGGRGRECGGGVRRG